MAVMDVVSKTVLAKQAQVSYAFASTILQSLSNDENFTSLGNSLEDTEIIWVGVSAVEVTWLWVNVTSP